MTAPPIAIQRTGLVTSVGLTAADSCAAFRGKISNPTETRFIDSSGEWIMAHQVALDQPWRGLVKLAKMAAMSIEEALKGVPRAEWNSLPLLLCVAEAERPGRTAGLNEQLFALVQKELGASFAPQSAVVPHGRVAVAVAMSQARSMLAQAPTGQRVLVAATDSLLSWPTLSHYEAGERLLTARNSNGFMPGEGAGALLLGTPTGDADELVCAGVGFAKEASHLDSGEPLRAQGLSQAIKLGLQDAGWQMHDLDFRITDISGEQYYFKEAAVALSRILRVRKAEFDLWHPAECAGETGAAAGALVLATAQMACRKGYSAGSRILAHMGQRRRAAWRDPAATRGGGVSNQIFANNMEVSCKKAAGKSICAFPDVCFTPPLTPATPPGVPIPYPNTGMASDTTSGSTSVKISGQEVMLKNKSYFKRSMGDEAGCAPKKGVVTSKNMGKVYFTMWSMDVKVEGENVVRMLDLTTHNHASQGPNSPPWPYIDEAAVAAGTGPCKDEMKREKENCADCKPNNPDGRDICAETGLTDKPGRRFDMEVQMPSGIAKNRQEVLAAADRAEAEACLRARRCQLQPYDSEKTGCCPGQTPHHLIEASALFDGGRGPGKARKGERSLPVDNFRPLAELNRGKPGYNEFDAPCICAEGCTNTVGTHGFMHTHQSTLNAATGIEEEIEYFFDGKVQKVTTNAHTYKQAKKNANTALSKTFPLSFCSEECINAQLDNYHNGIGVTDSTKIGAVECGSTKAANVEFAEQDALERAMNSSPYFNNSTWAPESGFGPPNLPNFGIGG